MENFAELNLHDFNPTEVFTEILSHFLSQKCLLLMSGAIFMENFHSDVENLKNRESLAQQIFPVYGTLYNYQIL